MKLKKTLGLVLIAGCMTSATVFASSETPIHGAEVNRSGLWASGYAHTEWNRAHCTKMKIGSTSTVASGVDYSETDTIEGWGKATSGYWET